MSTETENQPAGLGNFELLIVKKLFLLFGETLRAEWSWLWTVQRDELWWEDLLDAVIWRAFYLVAGMLVMHVVWCEVYFTL